MKRLILLLTFLHWWSVEGQHEVLEPGAYCSCFNFLKEELRDGQHSVEEVLDFFFEDKRVDTFTLAQLDEEVKNWRIGCSAGALFSYLDTNKDSKVCAKELGDYFRRCNWEDQIIDEL